MADYRVTYTMHASSGIVDDDVQNTWHFKTNEAVPDVPVALALCGHVSAAYGTIQAPGTVLPGTKISREISRTTHPTIRAYDVAGGSPLATATSLGLATGDSIDGLPTEVACCLSYNASLVNVPEELPDGSDPGSAPDRPAARRRGRIYFGPLTAQSTNQQSPALPADSLRDMLLGLGKFMANPTAPTLTAVLTQWVVYSSVDGISRPVNRVSVDNAFDTQRRRGRAATVRTSLTVP